MKVLAFAELRDGAFKKSSFETVRAARTLADSMNAGFAALVAGRGAAEAAPALGAYGAGRVLVADDPALDPYSNTAFAKKYSCCYAGLPRADIWLIIHDL